jgi:cobalt/nickel transport system permease protein
MHLEEFAEGQSFWHRMDPRVKILGVIGFALVTALATRTTVQAVAILVGFGAIATAQLDLKKVASRMAVVNGFVLFLWIFLPFTTGGRGVAQIGGLTLTAEGVLLAVSVTLKANAIAAATIALLGTSSVFDLVHALIHLRVPERLVQLFFFCYRYISVIHMEYVRLRNSMRLRCFTPRTDLHTYRSFAFLLGMLFVRSFDRSERIHQAMVLRGFAGTFWTLDHFHMHGRDWITLTGMSLLIGSMILLQFLGGFP